jgi:hypothetical protein
MPDGYIGTGVPKMIIVINLCSIAVGEMIQHSNFYRHGYTSSLRWKNQIV